MTRSLLLGLVVLFAACGNKTFDSLCAAQVPPPAGCDTACNPSGVANCPAGYHCSPDGKCDLFCTSSGSECGDGYRCTADGNCIKTGGGGGSGSNEPDASCPALHFTPKRTTPSVELLLDESSSMSANYGPNNTPPTRMVAMRTALIDPTNGVVVKLANQVIFGVSLYTGTGNAPPTCPTLTSEARAPNNLQAIRTLLNAAAPKSNTPTAASIDAVVAKFTTNPAPAGSPTIIVLATDGLPDTCSDQNPPENDPNDPRRLAANLTAVQAAQRSSAAGIKLFFLFIGPAVAGNHAQEMANAGAGLDPVSGRAPFFIATNPTELTQAFSTIIGGVVSCDLKLDSKLDLDDAPAGTVTIDGRMLSYPSEWNLDADGITIHILGNACTMLKSATNPVVDAAFPCGSVIE